jgi:GTP:adenosylcobinamide-phosphate guanylyltransferase
MAIEPMTAIALAGGRLERDFRDAGYDVANKAYLPIGGVLMLERVLSALRGASSVAQIRCVTQPDAFDAAFGARGAALCDAVVPPGDGLIDSMLAGFAGLPNERLVLVVATDIPLVRSSDVDAFAARVRSTPSDVAYGFVRREPHEARYPGVRHTWVHLREGTFCGGGISAIRAGAVAGLANALRRIVAARKSPLRLAAIFSPGLLARYVFGRLSIADAERRADAIAGCRCRGIACDEPELAVNVDRLADLRAVERILDEQKKT